MLKKKLLVSTAVAVLLSPIAVGSATSVQTYASTVAEEQNYGQVTYYSNQQLFDALEAEGYDLRDIYTEEEIQLAKAEDMSRAGVTQVVSTGQYTWDLYLSSAYTKAIAVSGDVASTVLGFLGFGKAGAILELGTLPLNSLDTSKGIYLNLKNVNIPGGQPTVTITGWGYQ